MGKTTASFTILPDILDCREFVNADEIARGLSPFQPEKVAFEAGRIMLKRIEGLIDQGVDFAFETTLSTRSYRSKVVELQTQGYHVTLLFFWLRNVEMAIERVKRRVVEGGHNIPRDTIIRRYSKGIKNLFELYLPICDEVMIVDNSSAKFGLIAESSKGEDVNVIDINKWKQLKSQYHEDGH